MVKFALFIACISSTVLSQPVKPPPEWKIKSVEFEGDTIIRHKYRIELGPDKNFRVKIATIKNKARNNGTFRSDTTYEKVDFHAAYESTTPDTGL